MSCCVVISCGWLERMFILVDVDISAQVADEIERDIWVIVSWYHVGDLIECLHQPK